MRARLVFPVLPRHPLLRALTLCALAIVLVGLIAMGFVVGIVLVTAAALVLAVRGWLARRAARAAEPTIIEGEYTVIPPHAPASVRHFE